MKQRIYFAKAVMMLLFVVLNATGAWASDVITIGEPTNTYGHMLPVGASNKYVLTQQVYTTDEFSHAAGKIWSMGFNTVKGGVSRHLSIYITHTESNGVWQYTPVTASDLVFSGDVFFKAEQWNTIEFDKPFDYNGTSNLLITICDDTGTKGNTSTLTNRFYNPGSTQTVYATSDEQAYDPTAANETTEFTSISGWKAQIQLTFGDYPTPAPVVLAEVTNVSAQVQCSLRGDATAWNLRYRKVANEGEEEQRWTQESDLTARSFTIEGLKPATKYETQVQAVFTEENLSDWSSPITFVTDCCPKEQQSEILFSARGSSSAESAFQIVDRETGTEAAYVLLANDEAFGGALTLCCGRTYDVYYISKAQWKNYEYNFTFSLFYLPGDEFYSMKPGEAPEALSGDENYGKPVLMTSFVMDCEKHCAPMPRFVTASNVTYQDATLNYQATTLKEEIQYSTDPAFPDDKTTTIEVTREDTEKETTYQLSNLESLTRYYVRVRSICDDDGNEETHDFSRWSKLISLITTSKYALPLRVNPTAITATKENLSWGRLGKEPMNNVNYRIRGEGTAASDPMMIDLDGDGESFDGYNDTYYSYGGKKADNVLAIANVPANALVSWMARNGKTGSSNTVGFQWGFVKQNKKYDMETDADAAQKALADALKAKKEQEEAQQADENFTAKSLEEAQALEARIAVLETEYCVLVPESEEAEQKQDEIRMLQMQLEGIQNELNMTEEQKNDAAAAQAALAGANGNKEEASQARPMRAQVTGGEEEYYFFYIRHHASTEILEVKDITITPPENIGNWSVIPNVEDIEYVLSGLQPGTEYEVMVQPVYESGVVGVGGPISVFSTIGEETNPSEGEFSVAEGKKVKFARGNLRFNANTEKWALAPQQYDILGESNVEAYTWASYLADYRDLFCWSTNSNRAGTGFYASYSDEDAARYFQGDFLDWGQNPDIMRDLGTGWSTLSQQEWDYLLNTRENAATLKALTTVNGIKGLLLLPDEWTAPEDFTEGIPAEISAEQWTQAEAAGAVFLPAAGQLTSVYQDYKTTTTFTETASYWMSTPSADESGWNAYVLSFTDTDIQLYGELKRRIGTAVRLVKTSMDSKQINAFDEYKKEKLTECDNMAEAGDDDDCKNLIANAKNAISQLAYDPDKTLEQNKAAADAIVTKLAKDLAAHRTTTGIVSIHNSQFTIHNDSPMYNLAGQRVGKNYKGIVIRNGKKMVIK